jgi:HD-GYP domain-containing protein (c-di-GMP phosphodiesterase class II)
MTTEEAITELVACSGKQFDETIVDAFIRAMDVASNRSSLETKELQLEIAIEETV